MVEYIFIKKTIDEWDPIGLLEMGCPDDEYEPEIREIERLAYHAESINELALGIQQVLVKWFDEYLPIEKCYPVALKIWTKYQGENGS